MSKHTDREPDAVYKFGKATVRIYGKAPSPEQLTPVCVQFMRAVEAARAALKAEAESA